MLWLCTYLYRSSRGAAAQSDWQASWKLGADTKNLDWLQENRARKTVSEIHSTPLGSYRMGKPSTNKISYVSFLPPACCIPKWWPVSQRWEQWPRSTANRFCRSRTSSLMLSLLSWWRWSVKAPLMTNTDIYCKWTLRMLWVHLFYLIIKTRNRTWLFENKLLFSLGYECVLSRGISLLDHL